MENNKFKDKARLLLETAGVEINGNRPFDIQVHDERLYKRVFSQGELGLGESYMDGWWDVEKIDDFFYRVITAKLQHTIKQDWNTLFELFRAQVFNLQKISRAFEVGQKHYDVGNDLYKVMLDKRMTYTCAVWDNANNLDEAQEAKLDLVCRKLDLKPGQRVLDIGCGFGSFAIYAAEKYGVSVVGVTVSKEQIDLGNKMKKQLPVDLRYQDYREVDGQFDHIVSLGMFEHVGKKNYRTFMQVVDRCLKENGTALIQTIGSNISLHGASPWTHRYIFPNSMLPSIRQIGSAMEGLFTVEDWQNIGANYDHTLMAWFNNFDSHWDDLKDNYTDRFYRMWSYYLLSSGGSFRARRLQVWQLVLSKTGILGGYDRSRYLINNSLEKNTGNGVSKNKIDIPKT